MNDISKRTPAAFDTDFEYRNREEKARYVYLKYGSILRGKILDAGADQGYLGTHLGEDVEYTTAGLERFHDVRADFEQPLPLPSNAYDCVLCLDVLEHVDPIYRFFDELCRVTRRYLIIALPNPWNDLIHTLRRGWYSPERSMKFYALTPEPLPDRHKWFFSASDAKRFLEVRGRRNDMHVVQIDQVGLRGLRKQLSRRLLRRVLPASIAPEDLIGSTVWAVLEKRVPR